MLDLVALFLSCHQCYEPQFRDCSHGFRPKRGCHTALLRVSQKGRGTKWFIEGDLRACFDKIEHSILLNILREKFHDNRFVRLIERLLKAGYFIHLTSRINNDAYSIVAQYQAEYRGVVQYYRMAYNLHTLNRLKWVMHLSLVKTLAKKFKTTCRQIYHRYKATISTTDGTFKVLQVVRPRESKTPLITHFGGVSWMKKMSAPRRKTLVVCRNCHHNIQYGRYDGHALKRKDYWKAT